ncbi:MAG: hypothetical protein ABEJ40_01080 [Haloarculaceae archaeon]
MTETLSQWCPDCEADREFFRAASTRIGTGTKVKWRCPECRYALVRIDRQPDAATA